MDTKTNDSVELFNSYCDGEKIHITCSLHADEFVLLRESTGELTQWCFGEVPHCSETHIDTQGIQKLMNYFDSDSIEKFFDILLTEFSVFDADVQLQNLCEDLGICYTVR